MQELLFTQASIYHLQQLASMVKQKTGVRHRLSDPKSVINLLRYSCTAADHTVNSEYNEFIATLRDEQRDYLQSRGLLIPYIMQNVAPMHEHYLPIAR